MEALEGYFQLQKKHEDAGEVWISGLLDRSKPDTQDLMIIADCFARMGCVARILAPVHFKSDDYEVIFGPLIGTRYERKCPDLCVDGHFYEYESFVRPWNKRKLSNMLTDGLRQSDKLILDCRGGSLNKTNPHSRSLGFRRGQCYRHIPIKIQGYPKVPCKEAHRGAL